MVGMGWMSGCSEEEQAACAGNEAVVLKSEGTDDAGIEQKILGFIDACRLAQSGTYPGGQPKYAPEEALWLSEAALNYAFGHPRSSFKEHMYDTIVIDIPMIGDSIDTGILALFTNNLLDSLSKFFASIPGNDNRILTVNANKEVQQYPGILTASFVFELGKKSNPIPPLFLYFDNTNWWFWGFGQGNCGPLGGSGFGSDAATVMMAKQGFFSYAGPVPTGYSLYYTDLSNAYAKPYDLPNPANTTANDNNYDYLLYLSNPAWPNHHDCLSPAEMTFYFNKLGGIVWHRLHPAGETQQSCHFLTLILVPEFLAPPAPPQLTGSNAHSIAVTYGKPHLRQNPYYPVYEPHFLWN